MQLNSGRIQLSTKNAVYSFEDRYTSFLRTFETLKIQQREIISVLVLGFGFGSVPLMLRKNFEQHAPVIGVEIDPEVVRLFEKYRPKVLEDNLKIVSKDALEFVESNAKQFDLVCVDLFLDEIVPAKFDTAEFLEPLRNTVSPKGLLLFNRMTSSDKLFKKTEVFRKGQFNDVFPNAEFVDTGGNRVLVWKR